MTNLPKRRIGVSTPLFLLIMAAILTTGRSFAQSSAFPAFLVKAAVTHANSVFAETQKAPEHKFSSEDAESAYQEARILYRRKAYDEALRTIKEALKIDPENEDYVILRDAIRGATLPEEADEEADKEKEADKAKEKPAEQKPPKKAPKGKGAKRKPGEVKTANIAGVLVRFHWCPPGEFMMGGSKEEGYSGETQHKVTLTKGFWIAETETTQGLWQAVMGEVPGKYEGASYPVYETSWYDCQDFIDVLNKQCAPKGCKFALPTEAQWEYACRAGTTTPFSFGNQLNGDKANCDGDQPYGTKIRGPYLDKRTPVGSYEPNPWGLYDMHGNVQEWCEDYFNDYPAEDVVDPICMTGSRKVARGGDYYNSASFCRSAARSYSMPNSSHNSSGFRLVIVEASK